LHAATSALTRLDLPRSTIGARRSCLNLPRSGEREGGCEEERRTLLGRSREEGGLEGEEGLGGREWEEGRR
jgi:hypothetical protein